MGTDLDMLVCGNYILYKDQQNIQLKEKYKNKFNLD
jgi:carbamoyltransferase